MTKQRSNEWMQHQATGCNKLNNTGDCSHDARWSQMQQCCDASEPVILGWCMYHSEGIVGDLDLPPFILRWCGKSHESLGQNSCKQKSNCLKCVRLHSINDWKAHCSDQMPTHASHCETNAIEEPRRTRPRATMCCHTHRTGNPSQADPSDGHGLAEEHLRQR